MTFVRPASERWDREVPAPTIDLRDPSAVVTPATTAAAAGTATGEITATVTAIDLSSVRVVAAFLGCAYAVLLVAFVVLWVAASVVGLVANVESLVRDTGFDTFRFAPLAIARALILVGVVLVAAGTAAGAVAIVLYNRLAERVPGLRFTMTVVTSTSGEHEVRSRSTMEPCPPTPAPWSTSTAAAMTTSPAESPRSRPTT